jgi:hypothetical protein
MYIIHGFYCYLLVVEISKLSQFLRHYMSQMQIFTTIYMRTLKQKYSIALIKLSNQYYAK